MDETETPTSFPPKPWLSIWTKPRVTIKRIVDSDPTRLVLVLAAFGGIFQSLDRASARSVGDKLDLGTILLVATILGALGGILYLYLAGALVRWTGSWMGGQASSRQIRAAIAWGSVPSLWVSLLWIPELLLFGQEMFTTDTPRLDANPALASVLLGLLLVELTGAIWAVVTTVKCLGQVQGFSAWKALGNGLLAATIVLIPVVVIVLAIGARS